MRIGESYHIFILKSSSHLKFNKVLFISWIVLESKLVELYIVNMIIKDCILLLLLFFFKV